MIHTHRHRAGFINSRIAVFVGVVLVPVMALAWVYYQNASTGGMRELPDGSVFVDLQAMSSFPFPQDTGTIEHVPERWRALSGRKVVLEGEMWANSATGGRVSDFDLVYSIAACCFVDEPQVQHFVRSTVASGDTVQLYSRPVRVRGTLTVDVTRNDRGQINGVYHLAVEDVRPI